MTSSVIIDKDHMVFDLQFGNRTVIVQMPAIVEGSGHATIGGKKVCIKGDEKSVKLDAMYMTSSHTIPGKGSVTIYSLDSSQMSVICNSPDKVITMGKNSFTACFTPSVPAMLPPPVSTSDPVLAPSYGQGRFISSQELVSA